MSTSSRALITALVLGVAMATPVEWRGVFYTPEKAYKWGAQKVKGKYADATMKLVAIPVAGATEQALVKAESKGVATMKLQCEEVQNGGVVTPMEDKCYKLVFDDKKTESIFTVNATSAGAIAFFAEHLPTEFEDTAHYFKDTSGADIEPVSQSPAGGAGHAHGHGTWKDEFEGKCVCQAQAKNWKLDCTKKAKISDALAKLEAKSACKAKDPPQDCINNYYVVQAHHDHCLHDQLPTGIELKMHDYEHFYDDCFVKRQFSPKLSVCPKITCSDSKALTNAVATLQAGCKTAKACAQTACSAAIKTVLNAHDTCAEKELPNNLEVALHEYEEPCAAELCNTAGAAFDPYDDKCSASVSSDGFGRQVSLLVTLSVFALVLLIAS